MNSTLIPGFTGARLDLCLLGYSLGSGYRVYLPSLMRLCSPDSMSPFDAGGIHPYVYCFDDPVNQRDPSGHVPSFVAIRDALGVKMIDAIGARLASRAAKRHAIDDAGGALEPAEGTYAEAPDASRPSTRVRKRKAAHPENAAKAPRYDEIAPPGQRPLADYVSEAKDRVTNNRREISAFWRKRYPRMGMSASYDVRRLTELETATMLARDDRVLVPAQRQELAQLLEYPSNRYDWLRSRVNAAQIIGAVADTSVTRELLTTLFGQQWVEAYPTEQL